MKKEAIRARMPEYIDSLNGVVYDFSELHKMVDDSLYDTDPIFVGSLEKIICKLANVIYEIENL